MEHGWCGLRWTVATHWLGFVCAFSDDGKYIVSGSNDRTIGVWDAISVAFSLNDTIFASGGEGTIIRLWKVMTGELVEKLTGLGEAVRSVALLRTALIVSPNDSTIQ